MQYPPTMPRILADRFVASGTDARQDVGAIGLDRHPPAASVSALAAAQIGRDGINVNRESGGDAFEDDDKRATMRFARGEKTHH